MSNALVVCNWKERAETQRNTRIQTFFDGGMVSTVWLMGIDHSFDGDKPLLFETMVFGGPLDQEMERYNSYEEAVEGHAQWVERVNEHQRI